MPIQEGGKTKAHYANKKAVNEDIAVKALTTADTVREDPTLVMVANAIGILTDLVKTIRSKVKDETLSTHHVFRTAAGSASYVDKNAVQTELENLSLTAKWRYNNQLHATVTTTTTHNKCACKNHTLEFAKYMALLLFVVTWYNIQACSRNDAHTGGWKNEGSLCQ